MGATTRSEISAARNAKHDPQSPNDLERIAEYVSKETRKHETAPFDAFTSTCAALAGFAVVAGQLPVVALIVALICRVAISMWQSNVTHLDVARIYLVQKARTPGWENNHGVSATRYAAKAAHATCAAELIWGLGALLLLLWFPIAFTAVAALSATLTVHAYVTFRSRMGKANDSIEECVQRAEWARAWQEDRAAREAAVDAYLAELS